MTTFGDRLIETRKKKKLTQEALAQKLGVSGQKIISNWENGVAKPEMDTMLTVSEVLEVSIDWLLTGKNKYNAPVTGTNMVKEEFIRYETAIGNAPTKSIPYYESVEITAGKANYIQDSHEIPSDFINIPWFTDCTLAFPFAGDSMYPRLQAGEILLCKELPNWRDYLPYGEIFVIITDSLRTVKYIKRAEDNNKYCLVSENPHYEPFEIDKSHILNILIVKGTIKRSLI